MFLLFRSYFLRRIKDGFREGSSLQDPAKVQVELERARNLLDVLKRQVTVFRLIFDVHCGLWNDVETASFGNVQILCLWSLTLSVLYSPHQWGRGADAPLPPLMCFSEMAAELRG